MGFYYPADYGPYLASQVTAQQPSTGRRASALRRALRSLIRYNVDVVPEMPTGRMLEIGCASGSFLSAMKSRGWLVQGIEFSPSAAARAQTAGFQVHCGSLEDAPTSDHRFNLIVGWMVLEHLHDPVKALSKLATWAAPDARLALSVPNAASLDFWMFKGAGYALHLPNHLYHFSPDSLASLLARTGWRVDRVMHQRALGNLFGSLGNLLEDCKAPTAIVHYFKRFPERARRANLILYPLAWLLALFGQTGRMTIWASRAPASTSTPTPCEQATS